ncbi:MAG TPA: DUF5666 domain-containing protein [Candidatus Sulfotelmatobacter sp.]
MSPNTIKLVLFLCIFSLLIYPRSSAAFPEPVFLSGTQENAIPPTASRRIGIIKAISGSTITLGPVPPDTAAEISITVGDATRIFRISPGETNLKNLTPLQLPDLQVGDRVRIVGKPSDDGQSIAASSVVAIRAADLEAKRHQEEQDWQKRGLGGLVSSIDPSNGTVKISVTSLGGTKSILVKTSSSTVFRRYSPDSVKFDDAKLSSLQEIRTGDQLRARGERNADGGELTADEVVTGSFRNIAGTINSVDPSAGIITVQDLLSKKAVKIKVSSDSQLHKLPAEMAQRIAMRLKGSASGGPAAPSGAAGNSSEGSNSAGQSTPTNGAERGPATTGGGHAGMGGAMRQGGDINQMLARMPAATLADLNKGDAVLIVATEGSAATDSTAITLVSGVEPILRAAPSASQAMMLAPWNLSGPSGDAANQ